MGPRAALHWRAAICAEHFVAHANWITCVAHHNFVAHPERAKILGVRRMTLHSDHPRIRASTTARFNCAEHATLSSGAENRDRRSRLRNTSHLRGRTRDIEYRKRKPLGKIGRQLRIRTRSKKDGFAIHIGADPPQPGESFLLKPHDLRPALPALMPRLAITPRSATLALKASERTICVTAAL